MMNPPQIATDAAASQPGYEQRIAGPSGQPAVTYVINTVAGTSASASDPQIKLSSTQALPGPSGSGSSCCKASASGNFGEENRTVVSSSPYASVATLCNTAVGAGMLSLPFAFQEAGKWLESNLAVTASGVCSTAD